MASHAAFKIALVRISFNTLTFEEIIDNGFDEISELSKVKDKDINKLIRHIGRWWVPRGPTHDATGVLIAPVLQQIALYLFLA